jgi:HSP20 family protein
MEVWKKRSRREEKGGTDVRDNRLMVLLFAVLVAVLFDVLVITVYVIRLDNRLLDSDDGADTTSPRVSRAVPAVTSSPESEDETARGDAGNVAPSSVAAWDPHREMLDLRRRVDELFDDSFARFPEALIGDTTDDATTFSPTIDIEQDADAYTVTVDLPGVSPENVEVNVSGRRVTVSGTRTETRESTDEEGQVIRRERFTGSFERSFTLPGAIDATEVETEHEDGVLTITIPKDEHMT